MSDDVGAALRSALGAERCGRCDDAVLDYVASVLQDEAFDDVDAALEAVGPLLVRPPRSLLPCVVCVTHPKTPPCALTLFCFSG